MILPNIDIKKMTRETIKYLNENFETWRNNPFLTFRYSIKRGFKHIGLWGVSLLYKWNIPMVYIRVYRFLVDKMKIDIKF